MHGPLLGEGSEWSRGTIFLTVGKRCAKPWGIAGVSGGLLGVLQGWSAEYLEEEERSDARKISGGFNPLWSYTQTRAVYALLPFCNHGDDSGDDDNRLDLHNTE